MHTLQAVFSLVFTVPIVKLTSTNAIYLANAMLSLIDNLGTLRLPPPRLIVHC